MKNENDIVVDAIRNSCTLVTFGTHKWQPMKTDANLAVEVKKSKSATGKAVSTKVNLANGFEHLLSNVTRVMSRAYHTHIRMTVPWGEGQRLLPNLQLVEYMQEMQGHRAALDKAKAELLTRLPSAIQQAIVNNADLGDIRDYPEPHIIADTFDYEWDFAPVSDVAGFAGLPEGFRERFESNYQHKVGTLLDEGVNDVKDRLRGLIGKWRSVLTSSKPKFFQSTIDNIAQLGTTLANLNITQDAGEAALAEAVQNFSRYSADQLRDNQQARDATLVSVDAVLAALGCANIDAAPEPTPVPEQENDLLKLDIPEPPVSTVETTVETQPTPEPEPEEPAQGKSEHAEESIEDLLNQLF